MLKYNTIQCKTKEMSRKLALRQPLVSSARDFIFLGSAHDEGCSVAFLVLVLGRTTRGRWRLSWRETGSTSVIT